MIPSITQPKKFEDVAHEIDIVLDTIGGETQERSWLVLNKGGALISLVEPPSEQKANQFGVRGIMCSVQPNGEARRAHELSARGHVRGKIVLRVKDIQL